MQGGNDNNGVKFSPPSFLQPQFSTLLLPPLFFGPLNDSPPGRYFADEEQLKHGAREELGRLSKQVYSRYKDGNIVLAICGRCFPTL